MTKTQRIVWSVLIILLGIALITMGILSNALKAEAHRYTVLYILLGSSFALLILTAIFRAFTEDGYRKVFTILFSLLAIGIFCLFLFFGLMWILLSEGAIGVLLRVMLSLYGIALIQAGTLSYWLSSEDYRPCLFDFFRQLPYAYYRYRT